MKRTISLFFALMLALTAVCCTASAETIFKTPIFTLTLPEGWIIATEKELKEMKEELDSDTDYDRDEPKTEEVFFGACYAMERNGMFIQISVEYYVEDEDYQTTQLWEASEEELEEYIGDTLEAYEDDDPEFLDIVKADIIPFVLIKGTGIDGEYLIADTMVKGFCFTFFAYVDEYRLSNKDIAQFKSIIETFRPVQQATGN